jgi:hypothetical protein
MKVLIKTFKGSESDVTEEINEILENCQGRWGSVNDVKTISATRDNKTGIIEITLLIQYEGSAILNDRKEYKQKE